MRPTPAQAVGVAVPGARQVQDLIREMPAAWAIFDGLGVAVYLEACRTVDESIRRHPGLAAALESAPRL